MAGTLPEAAQLNVLTNLIANMLSASYCRLLGASVTLGPTTTLATLLAAEATFTGYAKAALTTWTAPTTDGTTAAISTSTQAQFTPTGAGGSGNIYGYFLTDAGGTVFYGAELFTGGPISEPQNVTLEIDITYSDITRF